MAKMKVSIITVTYNNAATLADTIESVYQQTYQDIEYWIIDGASNDSTLDIIHENVERFQGRLHYISEPDKGIFDAMNKGIERCHGDIIGTLNADDYFTSDNVIEEVVKTFSKKDVDVVYGDIHFIHSDRPDKTVRYYSSALFRPFWLRFGFMPAHPSLYVRREVYQEVGPYSLEFTIASDFDMMIRIFARGRAATLICAKTSSPCALAASAPATSTAGLSSPRSKRQPAARTASTPTDCSSR